MMGEADRGARALFPPSISEILPEEHIARFLVRVVKGLDLSKLKAEYSPNLGRTGYAPAVLLTLWIYGYVKGVSSSHRLEEATWLNLDFMYIANDEHPDHTTLSNLRKNHQDVQAYDVTGLACGGGSRGDGFAWLDGGRHEVEGLCVPEEAHDFQSDEEPGRHHAGLQRPSGDGHGDPAARHVGRDCGGQRHVSDSAGAGCVGHVA